MQKPLLYLSALMIAAAGCGSSEFSISGNIKGLEGKTIYLQQFQDQAAINIDSAVVGSDGDFELERTLPHTDFYQLSAGEGNNFVFIGENGKKIRIESEKVITSPAKVDGSKHTELLMEFTGRYMAFALREDSIKRQMYEGASQMQVLEQLNQLNQEARQYFKSFIDKNYSSPAALAALRMLDPVEDIQYFKKVRDGIRKEMKQSPYFISLEEKIGESEQKAAAREAEMKMMEASEKVLPVGSMAPDISQPDPQGKIRSLKELKGKVVLVDFWASWCRPCRFESPYVLAAYKEYKSKGFEVFSVSLDRSSEAWQKAIKEDGLDWIHVSDLQYWNAAPARAYGVQSIPYFVLLDREGRIIAKNFRGSELSAKLKEILG